MKKFFLFLIIVIIGAGIVFFIYQKSDKKEKSLVLSDGTLTKSRLTDEEKKLVGVWEGDNGWICEIRERADYVQYEKEKIPLDKIWEDNPYITNGKRCLELDMILYDPKAMEWFKLTRNDTALVKKGDEIRMNDLHECPTLNDKGEPNGGTAVNVYSEIYDPKKDTLTCQFYNEEERYFSHTLNRTDKKINDKNWEWYYKLHPSRDPRVMHDDKASVFDLIKVMLTKKKE